MAAFGLLAPDNGTFRKHIGKVKAKLSDDNLVKNPFEGEVRLFRWGEGRLLCVVLIKPIYFNPTAYAVVGGVAFWLLFGTWKAALPFGFIALAGFLWSSPFYKLMFRFGLRKAKIGGVSFL